MSRAERGSAGRVVPAHELLDHLQGLEGSPTTDDLVAHARSIGAPDDVVSTLRRLPARRWESVEEATAAIGTGWSMRSDDQP